jgi:hypothetical protein
VARQEAYQDVRGGAPHRTPGRGMRNLQKVILTKTAKRLVLVLWEFSDHDRKE